MSKPIQVSASILCADFTKLGDEIKKCEDAGVDIIHVDVMDGNFVPNISIGQIIVEAIRPLTTLPIDAHLMIEHPWEYIDGFMDAGADMISIHAECYGDRRAECQSWNGWPKEIDMLNVDSLRKDVQRIKARDKKAFVVLNPGTPQCLNDVLDDIDGVLIMSVNPGFAKQKFISSVLSKVEVLRKVYDGDIAIDGGIKQDTAPEAVKVGVNILATASYFFGSDNPKETVKYMKSLGPQ